MAVKIPKTEKNIRNLVPVELISLHEHLSGHNTFSLNLKLRACSSETFSKK